MPLTCPDLDTLSRVHRDLIDYTQSGGDPAIREALRQRADAHREAAPLLPAVLEMWFRSEADLVASSRAGDDRALVDALLRAATVRGQAVMLLAAVEGGMAAAEGGS